MRVDNFSTIFSRLPWGWWNCELSIGVWSQFKFAIVTLFIMWIGVNISSWCDALLSFIIGGLASNFRGRFLLSSLLKQHNTNNNGPITGHVWRIQLAIGFVTHKNSMQKGEFVITQKYQARKKNRYCWISIQYKRPLPKVLFLQKKPFSNQHLHGVMVMPTDKLYLS